MAERARSAAQRHGLEKRRSLSIGAVTGAASEFGFALLLPIFDGLPCRNSRHNWVSRGQQERPNLQDSSYGQAVSGNATDWGKRIFWRL